MLLINYIQASYIILRSVVGESQATAVIYDTPSDVVAGSGPDTSENVAYGVTNTILTTPNPAYEVVHI